MAQLSELTHCLARIHIPSNSFVQCKQIRATLAQRSLCSVASARQEAGVLPDRKTCDKKKEKGSKKKRKENISLKADTKFRAKESWIFAWGLTSSYGLSKSKKRGKITIIWGHFQPSRLKMSHFSAEIVPRPDKNSAENVREISDFFFWLGKFGDNFSAEIVQLGNIFSAEFVPTGTFSALKLSRRTFSAQGKGHFQLKAGDIFS